jgi:hypothetical protein
VRKYARALIWLSVMLSSSGVALVGEQVDYSKPIGTGQL